ncbi:MAG: ABC transporter permease [Rhizobiales bacterium]|nr:ABC transporter permease [Hyphomicrobiales bacterium]
MSAAAPPGGAPARRFRVPPVATAILFAVLIGGLLVLLSGANPLEAYFQILVGALAPDNLPNTLNWAVPLCGMTLVAALPLRGGIVNLGGDGQMVIGGLAAALVPLYLPAPGPILTIAALLAAAVAAGLYAALAAWGEARHGIPTLISSLLLSYIAVGITSYIVGFPLRDTTTGLAQTVMIPEGARLPVISGALNAGFLLIAAIAAIVIFVDRRTVFGYELRMRGANLRFASYGGVRLARQSIIVMFASGAIAGIVGAVIVLGSQFRFTDGALLTPAYTWSGLMAALLAGGEPLGALAAGLFFSALQTGGFAMQRETSVPRVLTLVLQSIIILFLAVRHGIGRRR